MASSITFVSKIGPDFLRPPLVVLELFRFPVGRYGFSSLSLRLLVYPLVVSFVPKLGRSLWVEFFILALTLRPRMDDPSVLENLLSIRLEGEVTLRPLFVITEHGEVFLICRVVVRASEGLSS